MPPHAPARVRSPSPRGRTAVVSVVIPTLAEAPQIAAAVGNAFAAGADEVVVADGGSHDGTAELARAAGARVLLAPRGRGPQLNAGVRAARGDVPCFLHADGRLPAGAVRAIRRALEDPAAPGGNFSVRFGSTLHARLLAAFYHVIRRLGVYYDDSAIFCRREAFETVGWFPDWPIMEDMEFANRLRRLGPMAYLPELVSASPRRWERGGIPQAWASWVVIQSPYWAGVSPRRLAALYRHIR